MRGTYNYSLIKLIVTKLEKNLDGDLEQMFLDGEHSEAATITIAFANGLQRGEYLIMYQSEFTPVHEH